MALEYGLACRIPKDTSESNPLVRKEVAKEDVIFGHKLQFKVIARLSSHSQVSSESERWKVRRKVSERERFRKR